MNLKIVFYIVILLQCSIVGIEAIGQSLSPNYPLINEYYRREQLLGKIDPTFSFNLRPIFPVPAFDMDNAYALDSGLFDLEKSDLHQYLTASNQGKFLVLPLQLSSQYNSLYAHGINDGIMIPNRGLQGVLSGGIYMEYKSLSFQFQPELLMAQNKNYIGFPIEHQASILYYYEYLNRIDIPEQFGIGRYDLLLPGHSSLRFNHQEFSLGISSESLWWGPGRRNSLLMSNNAPGFFHFTLNTLKPKRTLIGSFEGQIFTGRLKNSDHLPPHSDYSIQQNLVYIPKREESRNLSGLLISYQPKWIEGLTLGYASVNQMYTSDINSFGDYLPIFNGQKGLNNVFNAKRNSRQQLSSGFFRWINTKGHFEFYGEYGTNGNSRRFKDFIITPEKNRAFTLGFTNLLPLKKENQYLQISSEMTQTGQTIREGIRNLDSWYIHNHVRHGYTHYGQVLGAGNGPAANVNWIEMAWVRNFTKIGLEFERIVYNNDYYYFRYEASKDLRNKYVDLVPAIVSDIKIGDNILINCSVKYVNTLNYKWYLENDPVFYVVPGFDRKNIHINLNMSVLLK